MKILKALLSTSNILALTIILLFNSSVASASYVSENRLKMIGKGEMSWMFIDIYQASLYNPSGKYNKQLYPQALKIVYQKNISKAQLLDATEKEWQKLSLDEKQYREWLTALHKLWPDIKKGDELLFTVEKDGKGFFYHNEQRLGGINSQQFPAAFMSIWLSKNTSRPGLRKQLIGE